jgi:hypothetical protein
MISGARCVPPGIVRHSYRKFTKILFQTKQSTPYLVRVRRPEESPVLVADVREICGAATLPRVQRESLSSVMMLLASVVHFVSSDRVHFRAVDLCAISASKGQ